jgi:fascin 1
MASRILTMSNIHHTSASGKFATNNLNIKSNNNTSSSSSSTCSDSSIISSSKSNLNTTNSSSSSSSSSSKWTLGLMNSESKYLTAENFGFKINATGNTLRKKQKWTIEQDNEEIAYLVSPLGNYLSTDKYGKLTCEKQTSDNDCKFYLEANGDGKWAFKSAVYGYYFGGSGDLLHCFSKSPEWWTVHLAIHPQVKK